MTSITGRRRRLALLGVVALLFVFVIARVTVVRGPDVWRWLRADWTQDQIAVLQSLWIGSLPDVPADPSDRYAEDPEAAELGQAIFFDTRFSQNGTFSCSSCHHPERLFTDGLPVGVALGATTRNTPTIVGAAYSPWQFHDGHADSQWSQALLPMESAVEQGGTRTQFAHLIAENYPSQYEAVFGPMPDLSDPDRFPKSAGPVDDPALRAAWEGMAPEDRMRVTRVYVNIGKAIEAYERRLKPGPSRFDDYVAALLQGDTLGRLKALSPDEVAGLRLFIGTGQCTSCHSGPLLTNNEFHNIGVADADPENPDLGRVTGVQEVLDSEFNCLGPFSDAGEGDCAELRFVKTTGHEIVRAFRTPTLRNVALTSPYMHDGSFKTLTEVMDFYNLAPRPSIGHSELVPLHLAEGELDQLVAFMKALDGGVQGDPKLLAAPQFPR